MIRILVALMIAACASSAPVCPVTPKIVGPTQPFLWKVEKGGVAVWLYGTIHTGGTDDVPDAAWTALESSPKVVTELGDVEVDQEKMIELIKLPPGKGLDQQLPASDWYDLRDALRGTIKEKDLARVRPWFAIVTLNAKISPPPKPGMDDAIAKRARSKGKLVEALESREFQLQELAKALTVADLQQEIRNRDNLACANSSLHATYAAGDLPGMMARQLLPQTERLIVDRTKAWVPKVEALFAAGGGFVAVGLAHLGGDEGLPALLAKAGYTVSRVP